MKAKSCSTTPPDRTAPNSYRDSGKAAFGLLENAPGDAEPCLTVTESCAPTGATTCCKPQEAKRGDKARKTILLVTREITNVLPMSFAVFGGQLVQIEAKLKELV